MKEKKISIIIPCYGTEKYLRRCLNSVINQTYKNLEIIPVDDCSPDSVYKILREYSSRDDRIKIVTHEKNKGLFQARLSGAKVATGDYIAFLDSDDYVDFDFYRELITTAMDTSSDIVVCNTVVEESDRKFIYNLFSTGKTIIQKDELLDEYFNQKGLNYRWHTVWNKIYSIELWKKCVDHYKDIIGHLIMTEDFAFSTVLYYYANKLTYNERANYFYCSNDDASTSLNKLTTKKCEKNVTDIKKSFDFVEQFLKKQRIYTKYKEQFIYWKSLYLKIWYDNIVNSKFEQSEEERLLSIVLDNDASILDFDYKDKDNFYKATTDFNEGLLDLKNKILENDIISFDIFDTLIYRPFYEPKDMFDLLNFEYNKIFKSNGLLEFSKIRVEAEENVRKKIWLEKGFEEVTLDDIYNFINQRYGLDKAKLDKLKIKETELEINFCTRRETIYSIYRLCKYLNKKVVATSDIYLPRTVIERILELNEYTGFDRIYLSSEEKITKSSGNLFKHLVIEQRKNPNRILHIGDNVNSDVDIPTELGLNTFYFPKATDLFNNYCFKENNVNYCGRLYENFELLNIDHDYVTNHMGNRVSMAIIANKFFDNPFVSFNGNSDFNCNPYFIGYYALGMHMLALTSWMLSDSKRKEYDSICFMARDGYLPYLASQILKPIYGSEKTELKYIYVSRKAIMPLTLKEYKDFIKIQDYIQIDKVKVGDIIDSLKYILNLDGDYAAKLRNHSFELDDIIDDKNTYYELMDIIYYELYDSYRYQNHFDAAKKYFESFFTGKSATFDIGYSAQPELIISGVLNKPIDTYFIHSNNDSSYKNSKYGNFRLKTFYDFKPTFTGTLREYLISSDSPSCIGYVNKDNGDVEVVFEEKEKYTYFNKKILNEIQNGCLDFLETFKNYFKDYTDIIELNNYYMSLPFEYYLHYSKDFDRDIFYNLTFEQNVSENVNILDFWKNRLEEYNKYNNNYNKKDKNDLNTTEYTYKAFLHERVTFRSKFTKLLFYITFDRVALRNKIGEKLNYEGIIYKSLRKFHKIFKRR